MSPERILRPAKYRASATTGIPSRAQSKALQRASTASRPTDLIAPISNKKSEIPSNAVLRPYRARVTNDAISSAYTKFVPRIHRENLDAFSSRAFSNFSLRAPTNAYRAR